MVLLRNLNSSALTVERDNLVVNLNSDSSWHKRFDFSVHAVLVP